MAAPSTKLIVKLSIEKDGEDKPVYVAIITRVIFGRGNKYEVKEGQYATYAQYCAFLDGLHIGASAAGVEVEEDGRIPQ